jgi:hypothetical protein
MGKGQAAFCPRLQAQNPKSWPKSTIPHFGLKPLARFEYQTKIPTFALV